MTGQGGREGGKDRSRRTVRSRKGWEVAGRITVGREGGEKLRGICCLFRTQETKSDDGGGKVWTDEDGMKEVGGSRMCTIKKPFECVGNTRDGR